MTTILAICECITFDCKFMLIGLLNIIIVVFLLQPPTRTTCCCCYCC